MQRDIYTEILFTSRILNVHFYGRTYTHNSLDMGPVSAADFHPTFGSNKRA